MKVFAIDPGTRESGYVLFDGNKVLLSGVQENNSLLRFVQCGCMDSSIKRLAIEMIASYGMAVGREVFETCVWVGRFQQAWHSPEDVELVYRKDVKMHVCGTTKAKDANVRQGLIDMFKPLGGGKTPQIGTKSLPGPLYGVSSHAWPALGVAITARHRLTAYHLEEL